MCVKHIVLVAPPVHGADAQQIIDKAKRLATLDPSTVSKGAGLTCCAANRISAFFDD
jgi:adenylyl- and sulfurtransferase ThiI